MAIPTLNAVQTTAVETLTALAQRHATVRIGPKFDYEGVGSYADEGMHATLTKFYYSEKYEGWEVVLDYLPFEAHNIPLEQANFYGPNDTMVTARAGGNYKPQESWYIDLNDWTERLSVVNDGYTGVLSSIHQADPRGLSYVAWLEAMVAEQLHLTA